MRRVLVAAALVVAAASVAVAGTALVPAGAGTSRLIAVNDDTGEVFQIPISGGAATNLNVTGIGQGVGLAYNPNTDTVFAISLDNPPTLYSFPSSGGTAATNLGTVSGLNRSPCGLEYDPVGNQLWATDFSGGTKNL